ncbi:MAG: hypothetical protein ABIK65_12170 [Candidatus Eisenbacteria bacterium]
MQIRHLRGITTLAFILIPLTAGAAAADRALYERKCGRCHVAYDPGDFAADEWPGILLSMRAKAALTPEEQQTLLDWLGEEGGGERPGTSGPKVGGYLYTEYFETEEKSENYDLHYLAVSLSGRAAENIAYVGEFELEHGGRGDDVFVEQAYLDYWFLPNAALKIGAILTPFNRFDEFHDPLANYTITRPQSASAIGVSAWKEAGADLHGYFNAGPDASIGFDLYTVNGLGAGGNLRGSRQYRDNNEDKAFGGRVNVMFRDLLEVGGSAYHGAWDDEGELDLDLFGGHLLLRTPFVEIYGEYADGRSENPAGTPDGEMSGFFIQASRLIASRCRPTIRYGEIDYLDTGAALGREPADTDRKELGVTFAIYPTPRVVFKAEATFFVEGERETDVDDDQVGLQAAIRF